MVHDEYKLSCVLFGHSLDVRCLAVKADNCILSGSRDKTAKLWKPNGFNPGYTDTLTLRSHKNYVSSVLFLDNAPEHPNGLVLTGGNDSTICIFDIDVSDPLIMVKGHKNTVCSLSKGNKAGTFLTGSWDCTAKLWLVSNLTLKEMVVFSGHQAAVWSCIQLPNDTIATASADKDIIIWSQEGKKINVLKGHTDCVRGLAILNDFIFLSIGNDATIKQWTTHGQCVNTLYGHGNYIYSISVNQITQNAFVTSGEDRVVKIWKDDKEVQTLLLPAQSVWAVAHLNNGDIVTGSSDGKVRVFTQDPARMADEEALKIFQEEVSNLKAASSQEIGGVKLSDLPGKEALYEPGKRDGQTKLVREGTTVICYSWSESTGTWDKIGDVMGAAGGTQANSGKTLYEGKEYDFVFSVDIEDGKPPIKLPYNKDQDPWFAAQEFIHKNNLPQAYLEQVANFIVQNSGVTHVAPTNTVEFADPFTGGSRYMPSGSGSTTNTAGSNMDPFTGSQSYTTTSNPSQTSVTPKYFPQTTYLRFDQGNVEVIFNKLKEFNKKPGNSFKVEEVMLEEVVRLADNAIGDSLYIDALMQLLNWSNDIVFPVLDITRLAVRHAEQNDLLCTHMNGEYLLQTLRKHLTEANMTNRMLTLRILCNMFVHSAGELLIVNNRAAFLSDVRSLDANPNKTYEVALSTFLLNLCVALIKLKMVDGMSGLVETLIDTILKINNPEAEFRGFVALGTLLSQLEPVSIVEILESVTSMPKLKEKLSEVSNEYTNDSSTLRNVNCATQLNNLLL